MRPLKQESITDRVREILQRAIEAGRMEPGTRIFEEALAKELGISKTPLRLALYQLKQDGIVRIEPRKGIYVATPTETEVRELLEIREALEGIAARRAATLKNSSLVARLKACFAGFDEANLGDQRTKYAAADHRFHRLITEASGNQELVKALEVVNIRLHMNRLRAGVTRRHDLRPIHREHMSILASIEAGDAQKAESAVRSHIRNIAKQMVLVDLPSTGAVLRPRRAGEVPANQ